jgi:hypothetical protein
MNWGENKRLVVTDLAWWALPARDAVAETPLSENKFTVCGPDNAPHQDPDNTMNALRK